jgi:lipoprotein LprG
MRRPTALAGAFALLLTVLVACTGRDAPIDAAAGVAPSAGEQQPPPAGSLLASAEAELRTVRTVRFALTTEGAAATLGIRAASGRITSAGEADGAAQLVQAGKPAEFAFVIKNGDFWVSGLSGREWQRLPLSAAAIYDPTAMLSPDRGIAKLVGTATGTTEGRETVDGVDSYRIKGTLAGAAVGVLVPGVAQDVTGTLWIGADRRLLHRATFSVPGQAGNVTVTFSQFDQPMTIQAPLPTASPTPPAPVAR